MIHIALLALALQTTPPAQTPPPAPPPVDCTDADHSAFNFWLGEWDVSQTGTDTVVARSTISSAAGGCAVEENYHQTVGQGGAAISYRGSSFSVFDAGNGRKWRQFYVDSGGSVVMFEGGVQDAAMVLDAPGGPGVIQRMTVAPEADGSVRQWGVTSRDEGATWTSAGYDFTYRRR
ncbi:MAG: hypothetical protein ACOH1E_10070 [Brevundimonas sp.]